MTERASQHQYPVGFEFQNNGRTLVVVDTVGGPEYPGSESLYIVEYKERRPEDSGKQAWTMLLTSQIARMTEKGSQ